MSDELPQGWVEAAVEEIAEINPRHPSNLDDSLPVTFIPMPAVSEGSWALKFKEERILKDVRKGYTHFTDGDVLFAKITPCMENGKGAVATELKNGLGCGSTEFHVLRLYGGIEPKLIYFFLKQNSFRKDAARNFTGTAGQLRVPVSFIRETRIPLAPLPEQRRIVAKLEILSAKMDACQKRLAKIPVLLKRFRQSVLTGACSGKLTEDWREQYPNVRTSIEIINSLKTPTPVPYDDVFEKSKNIELPKSWSWIQLGKLGQVIGGGTPSKDNPKYWNGNIPWISPKDMKYFRIHNSYDHITELALEHSTIKIIPRGSILFVVRGMILSHTLPTAIIDNVATINQDMKALVPEKSDMSEYLAFVSKYISPSVLFEVKESTHGTKRLESSILKNWAIPIPPIPEQQEIVRRVKALFVLADQIEARYAKAKMFVDKLTQSILAKAFRGELARQDPNDEPASVLMERIKGMR